MRLAIVAVLLCLADPVHGQPPSPERAAPPAFLPGYYLSAADFEGQDLRLSEHIDQDHLDRYTYISRDQGVTLSIDSYACDSILCATVYGNALRFLNKQTTDNKGHFRTATDTEFRVDWQTGFSEDTTFVFKLPRSVLFWTYGARLGNDIQADRRFAAIKAATNRHRYEQALPQGNVEVGRWHRQFLDLARDWLKQGKTAEALDVLRNLLATAPFDYEAQLEFAATTTDATAARNSARAVFDNAEGPDLVERSAQLLGVAIPTLTSVPLLKPNEHGLQVILVPLPPCDIRLLSEAAAIYSRITDIPVQIARLHEAWDFGPPDRIPDERAVRQTIIQRAGPGTDFSGWTLQQYTSALLQSVIDKDALARFSMEAFVDKLPNRPGQYNVDRYLLHFIRLIGTYWSGDIKTMYVGVTGANIYAGDTNYLFSQYTAPNGTGASILSYAMMTAATLNEQYESRKRLAERLAKELVPASLKSLGIPRPADPTDPYSYSDGVVRLEQKTLMLSEPTREALALFR